MMTFYTRQYADRTLMSLDKSLWWEAKRLEALQPKTQQRKDMTCSHSIQPRLVEYGVNNPPKGPLQDWRMYRIEYGFECGCPEGTIWLPPNVDRDGFEAYLESLIERP